MLAVNLHQKHSETMYLKDNGIHIHQSAPYTHQQNGHAERLIQILMDKAQAMHLHACLSDSYWEFAILHMAHIYNIMPINQLIGEHLWNYLRGRNLLFLIFMCSDMVPTCIFLMKHAKISCNLNHSSWYISV